MKVEKISYDRLLEAIEIAFTGDAKIIDFYDPNVVVNSIESIVKNVSKKISEYDGAEYYGVYINRELVGYFVFEGEMLISFALNINYRKRQNLREFYRAIIRKTGKGTFCYLWSKNVRAIKWLQKMGMEVKDDINHFNFLVTKLIYSPL